MSDTPSISFARQCVEHLIHLHGKDADSSVIDGAKRAAVVLAWLERRDELVKAVERLDREAPGLAALLKAFPGASIADVRPVNAPHTYEDENDYHDTFG